MAVHLPIGPQNPILGWSWYWDVNLEPTSRLVTDLAPTGSYLLFKEIYLKDNGSNGSKLRNVETQ